MCASWHISLPKEDTSLILKGKNMLSAEYCRSFVSSFEGCYVKLSCCSEPAGISALIPAPCIESFNDLLRAFT